MSCGRGSQSWEGIGLVPSTHIRHNSSSRRLDGSGLPWHLDSHGIIHMHAHTHKLKTKQNVLIILLCMKCMHVHVGTCPMAQTYRSENNFSWFPFFCSQIQSRS